MATWGAQTWGYQNWGTLGDQTVDLSSVSLLTTLSQGTVTVDAELQIGWGGDTWGENNWGDLSGAVQLLTGLQLNSNINSVIVDAEINAGWGRHTFGNLGWGVNYSVIGGGVNGLSLNAAIGNEDAFTDISVTLSGFQLSADITPVGTSATSDNEIAHSFLLENDLGSVSIEGHSLVELTGIGLSSAITDVEASPKTEVEVTGVSATYVLGDEDQTGTGVVVLTGIGSTMAMGDATPVSKYDVTGISATYATPGNVVVIGEATVVPTGIGLTISTVTPNVIAWAEVDVGTPVTWTPVDLAA